MKETNGIQLIVVEQYTEQNSASIGSLFGVGGGSDSTSHTTKIIWAIIGATVVLILAGVVFFFYFRSKSSGAEDDMYGDMEGAEKTMIDTSRDVENYKP